MKLITKKMIVSSLVLGLTLQVLGCGTILHPERKGQRAGEIDPKIAIFDAIGLLFFFVPGVIAFAVDFSNGTIYLPGGKRASLTQEEMQKITINTNQCDTEKLIQLLQEKGIVDKGIAANEVQFKQLDSVAQLDSYLLVSGQQLAMRQ